MEYIEAVGIVLVVIGGVVLLARRANRRALERQVAMRSTASTNPVVNARRRDTGDTETVTAVSIFSDIEPASSKSSGDSGGFFGGGDGGGSGGGDAGGF